MRKVREGATTNDLFAILTTDPNVEVGTVHPKAMPVILTTPEEWETWLTAPATKALALQRPLIQTSGGYAIEEAAGFKLFDVYGRDHQSESDTNNQTADEAHRLTANIALLPDLLHAERASKPADRKVQAWQAALLLPFLAAGTVTGCAGREVRADASENRRR